MQSKVNDMLMDVMIQRLISSVTVMHVQHPETLDVLIQKVGGDMGFRVRLEQFRRHKAGSITEALARESFLFLGYYFHVIGGDQVAVHCDVARTLSQVPYPTLKWIKDDQETLTMEAMRIGSIAQNLGVPSRELQKSFDAMREYALTLVERAIHEGGDVSADRLIWAVSDNPFAGDPIPSLKGLLRVLQRPPSVLWLGELPAETEFISNWADEVEEEETVNAFMGRHTAIAMLRSLRPIRTRPIPTHPATLTNDGRPGPTAVWAPDKPKRQVAIDRLKEARSARKRGVGRAQAASPSTTETVSWNSEDDWDFDD